MTMRLAGCHDHAGVPKEFSPLQPRPRASDGRAAEDPKEFSPLQPRPRASDALALSGTSAVVAAETTANVCSIGTITRWSRW